MDMTDGDEYYPHRPSMEEEDGNDYTHLTSEEEDSHEYFRPEDFAALMVRLDLAAYMLADLMEARGAAASTTAIIPSVGVVGGIEDSELAGPVAEALVTVEAPSDGRDCAICLQDDDTAAWKETRCGHRFHGRCVERWLQAKWSCPMCRSQLVTMPTAAATSTDLEIQRSVILELFRLVMANSGLTEEEIVAAFLGIEN